jgi:Glycosyl hydrolases family 2, TIM barrel domain
MTHGILEQAASSNRTPLSEGRLTVDGRFLARDGQRVRLHGVTYGPFAPNVDGHPFPPPRQVREDFRQMTDVGINSIRTYHVPPPAVLDAVEETPGLGVMIDIPWSKHLCFLDSREAQREARQAVHMAAALGRNYGCVLAYSVCNEIAPDIIRWHGARRVEKFLAELADVVKQADPDGLVTFANYPSAEYLDLSFLDFITFNRPIFSPATSAKRCCADWPARLFFPGPTNGTREITRSITGPSASPEPIELPRRRCTRCRSSTSNH